MKLLNNIEAYIKGPHCEESIKDLNRFCKKDDPDLPVTRLELGKWNILVSDLLPLLTT